MRYVTLDHWISFLAMLMVAAVVWILFLTAAIYVFGCSMSLEVESEMHHHESEGLFQPEPTPTPAARIN